MKPTRRDAEGHELSHVGMDLCFLCNEPKAVILHKRLAPVLPRAAVYDRAPCDKCKGYMKQGVIMISVNEKLTTDEKNPWRSGGWVVMTEDWCRRALTPQELIDIVLKHRVAFVPDEAWMKLGLPYGSVQADSPDYGPPHGR